MMVDQDDPDGLLRWVKIMNKNRGYGGTLNHETAEDKRTVELATATEWRRAAIAEFSLQLGWPEHNPNDPPDCFVDLAGRRVGVELVKLISQKHLERAARGETPYAGQIFRDIQWSKERFGSEIQNVLQRKGSMYAKNGMQIDVLVICAAEPWLTSTQAEQWLDELLLAPHESISNLFLLLDYEPGPPDHASAASRHWPVFWIYGDMFRTAGDSTT